MRMQAVGVALAVLAASVAQADWLNLPVLKQQDAPATEAPMVGSGFTSARVRVLDKQTNRVETLVLKAKTKQTSGMLALTLGRCVGDLQGIPGDDAAWLDVRDNSGENALFSGWMFSEAPQVAALDHPRYDVQVVGCGDAPRGRVGSKAVVTNVGDGEDDEAPSAKASAKPVAPASEQDELHQLMDGR